MPQPTYPIFAQTPILPEPTKVNFVCASLTVGVTPLIGLQVSTPLGVQFYFMSRDEAIELSKTLARIVGNIQPATLAIKEEVI